MMVPAWWDVCELVAHKYGLCIVFRASSEFIKIVVSSEETGYDHQIEGTIDRTINPAHYYLLVYGLCEQWWKEHTKLTKRAKNKRNPRRK